MTNINNWLIGTVAIIGGCSILALLVKSCRKKSYPEYISNYSAPPQNIGYAVKLAIKSWQV